VQVSEVCTVIEVLDGIPRPASTASQTPWPRNLPRFETASWARSSPSKKTTILARHRFSATTFHIKEGAKPSSPPAPALRSAGRRGRHLPPSSNYLASVPSVARGPEGGGQRVRGPQVGGGAPEQGPVHHLAAGEKKQKKTGGGNKKASSPAYRSTYPVPPRLALSHPVSMSRGAHPASGRRSSDDPHCVGQRELIIGDRQVTGKTASSPSTRSSTRRGLGVSASTSASGRRKSTVAAIVDWLKAHAAMDYTTVSSPPPPTRRRSSTRPPTAGCTMRVLHVEG